MTKEEINAMTESFEELVEAVKELDGTDRKDAIKALNDQWDKHFQMMKDVTVIIQKIWDGEETPEISAMKRLEFELEIKKGENTPVMSDEDISSVKVAFLYAQAADKDMNEDLIFPFLKEMVSISINMKIGLKSLPKNREIIESIIRDVEEGK